jgi:hypothetical protein
MKLTRILASLSIVLGTLLALSANAEASLDGTNPGNGAHYVPRDSNIKARFSGTANGATATTFVVNGAHSNKRGGVYTGNGSNALTFDATNDFKAGERLHVTMTSGITGLSAAHVHTFTARTQRTEGSFSTPQTIYAGGANWAFGSGVGDIDGDGDVDMVIPVAIGGGLRVVMNPGVPTTVSTATTVTTLATPNTQWPHTTHVADLNNDGYGDILMGAYSGYGQNQYYLWNPGTSSFSAPVVYDAAGALGVAVGDLNGDGFLDVAYAGAPDSVCLNNGSGGFGSPVQIASGGYYSSECDIADFDGDGDLDIVSVSSGGAYVFLNPGNGDFSNATIVSITSSVTFDGVRAGDMDGDGYVDFVAVGYGGNCVFFNSGYASFTSGSSFGASTNQRMVDLGDMDGDGDLDAVVGYWGSQNYIHFNNGDGTFNAANDEPFGLGNEYHEGQNIDVADMDNDGDLDIFVGGLMSYSYVTFNEISGPRLAGLVPALHADAAPASTNIAASFTAPMAAATPATFSVRGSLTGPHGGAYSGATTTALGFNPTADFAPGEIVEVTLTGLQSSASEPVIRGDVARFRVAAQAGPVEFDQKTWTAIGASLSTQAVVSGDIDGDAQIELVFGFASGSPKVVTVGATAASTPWDVAGGNDDVRALDLADVDGDGDLDLAVGVFNGQSKVYLYDSAAGDFGGGTNNLGGANDAVTALQFADMNADGHSDLVVGCSAAQNVIYLNDGAGNFTAGCNFGSSGVDTSALAIGDVDNDGDLDVFEGNFQAYNFVRLNDGRGNINGSSRIGTQVGQTRAAEMADLNNDGWIDIVVGEYAATSTVHLNDRGTFPTEASLISGAPNTCALKLGDFDGDGDLDAATANGGAPGEILLNNGAGTFTSGGSFGPNDANSLAVADMDADGDLDIAAGRFNNPSAIRFNELLPTVAFSASQHTVNESAASASVTVTMSQVHTTSVSVSWAATAGTATNGVDFTAASGLLTFTPGQTSKTFTVAIIGDALDEVDETVSLALSNVSGGVLGSSAATLSILDDDGSPTVRFTTATHIHGESGSVDIFVELSNPTGLPVTVDYASSNGTATSGADYTAVSGQLSFPVGVLSRSFTVAITPDNIDEIDEAFDITLSNPQNATTGALGGTTVTITDDDATPEINIAPISITVQENAGTLNFSVSLSGTSASAISVDFTSQNGSASAGQDFAAVTGTLVIPAGSTTGSISLTINDDSENEPVELFQLVLTTPANAVLGADSVAVITIVQDPNDVFQVGAAGGGSGGGGGGCVAAAGNLGWTLLLLLALFGLAVLRTRQAR